MNTMADPRAAVFSGVDTHLDVHVAAALDGVGGELGVESFPTTTAGYAQLLGWLTGFGAVTKVGVEGTGSYGAGLTRHLLDAGVAVVEVVCHQETGQFVSIVLSSRIQPLLREG